MGANDSRASSLKRLSLDRQRSRLDGRKRLALSSRLEHLYLAKRAELRALDGRKQLARLKFKTSLSLSPTEPT